MSNGCEDEIDPWSIEGFSDDELRDRLDELDDVPYLNQARSNEYDLIESVLRAREIRREKESADFSKPRMSCSGGVIL